MKTILLVIGLTLSVHHTYAQCKYETNEVDKFTKKTVLKTKYTALWQSMFHALSFKAKKLDTIRFLEMTYSTSYIYSVEKDSKLMFLMGNDSIVTLIAMGYETANGVTAGTVTIWSAIVDYYLSAKDHAILMSNTIVNVRFYTRNGYIEKDVKNKRGGNLRNILRCI